MVRFKWALLLLFLLSSCIFLNPFYNETSIIDLPQIEGSWALQDQLKATNVDSFTIQKKRKKYFLTRFSGNIVSFYALVPFKSGNQIYIDMEEQEYSDERKMYSSKNTSHFIFKFGLVSDSSFILYFLNYDLVVKNIKNKTLTLTHKGLHENDIYVTAQAEELQNFLNHIADKKEYWAEELKLVRWKLQGYANKYDELIYYLQNGRRESAMQLTAEYRFSNDYRDRTGNTLLFIVSKYDEVVLDTLLSHLTPGSDRRISTNRGKGPDWSKSVFCNLETENIAVDLIDKMKFDEKPYCNHKDILLFFMDKKWYRCIEHYMSKYGDRVYPGYTTAEYSEHLFRKEPNGLYECQIQYLDSAENRWRFKTVDPYEYTKDNSTVAAIRKYKFKK